MAKSGLTAKQARFVEEYLVDLNAAAAARRAGYELGCEPAGYYVYFLIDPRDQAIFYVGKGKGKRMQSHAKSPKSQSGGNGKKLSVIREIQKQSMKVIERTFCCDLSEPEAYRLERLLIKALKGTLANMAGGTTTSAESRMEMAKIILGRLLPYDLWIKTATKKQLRFAVIAGGSLEEFYEKLCRGLTPEINDPHPMSISFEIRGRYGER